MSKDNFHLLWTLRTPVVGFDDLCGTEVRQNWKTLHETNLPTFDIWLASSRIGYTSVRLPILLVHDFDLLYFPVQRKWIVAVPLVSWIMLNQLTENEDSDY